MDIGTLGYVWHKLNEFGADVIDPGKHQLWKARPLPSSAAAFARSAKRV